MPAEISDVELLPALAARRLATAWRLWAGAAIAAWLVLMTIWGVGRASVADATGFLVAGLLGALVTFGAIAVRVRQRMAAVKRWIR